MIEIALNLIFEVYRELKIVKQISRPIFIEDLAE